MQTKMIPRTASYRVCVFNNYLFYFELYYINGYSSFPAGETARIATLALGKVQKSVGRVILEIEWHMTWLNSPV